MRLKSSQIVALVILVAGLVSMLLFLGRKQIFKGHAAGGTATLTLSPNSTTNFSAAPNTTFDVAVILNPDVNAVVGTDVVLSFDQNTLAITNVAPSPTQSNNNLRTYVPLNANGSINFGQANSTGRLEFSALTYAPSPAPGSVLPAQTTPISPLAIVTFQVKPAATALTSTIKVVSSPGNTTDSNIVSLQANVPVDVISDSTSTMADSQLIVSIPQPTPTPLPSPISSPTPTPTPNPTPISSPTPTPTPTPFTSNLFGSITCTPQNTTDALNLTWTADPSVSTYTLEECNDLSCSNPTTRFIDPSTTNATESTQTGIAGQATLYFRIKSTINTLAVTYSNVAKFTNNLCTVHASPSPVPSPTPTAVPTSTPTPTPTTAAKPGDANGDGIVSGIDYIIWRNHYNQTVTQGASVGDFNGDSHVTGIDYIIWRNNYGK